MADPGYFGPANVTASTRGTTGPRRRLRALLRQALHPEAMGVMSAGRLQLAS